MSKTSVAQRICNATGGAVSDNVIHLVTDPLRTQVNFFMLRRIGELLLPPQEWPLTWNRAPIPRGIQYCSTKFGPSYFKMPPSISWLSAPPTVKKYSLAFRRPAPASTILYCAGCAEDSRRSTLQPGNSKKS